MHIVDLHQDRSDNALCTTHKDFFTHGTIDDGWNMENDMIAANQVDLPRLKKGGAKAIITALFIEPETMKGSNNSIFAEKAYPPTQAAKYELYRHNKFYDNIVSRSQGSLTIIKNKSDLSKVLATDTIGIIKHIEGFYFTDKGDKNFNSLDNAIAMGVRSIGLTRNIDNALAASCTNKKDGLTEKGKNFIKYLTENNIIIDLAHLSKKGIKEVLDIVQTPLMVSHTALSSNTKEGRFLSTDDAKNIAKNGGMIGIMTMKHNDYQYPIYDLKSYVEHIRSAISLIGEDHVAIGTDFDGLTKDNVLQGFEDAEQYPSLIEMMKKKGITQKQIEKIAHKNALRFFNETLK